MKKIYPKIAKAIIHGIPCGDVSTTVLIATLEKLQKDLELGQGKKKLYIDSIVMS